tara:strand:+ start:20903 stop:21712 length:810 start_codon:yes stop_codon:yes gene_type:complete
MKNKLQQDLRDLANEILQQKEVKGARLKQIVAKMYENICVLEYLEQQIDGVKPSEKTKNEEAFDSKSYKEQNWFTEPEPIEQPQHKEDLVEPLMEKIKDLVAQMPPESQELDDFLEEVLPQKKYMKNDLEEFAKTYQQTPTFERKAAAPPPSMPETKLEEREPAKGTPEPENKTRLVDDLGVSKKPKSINDQAGNAMNIGLNDRLAYIKHLFSGNADDYTRVLSQINTLQTFDEAETFIKTKVKPDYNFWVEKEEYANRFMTSVERKFN